MDRARVDPAGLLADLVGLIREAGRQVMQVYRSDFDVQSKADESPVTAADRLAERVILAGLRRRTPGLPIVAEESAAAGPLPDAGDRFWLVDPVDGTREFVQRNGEFTVNVALIDRGRPVLGLVLAPALGRLFCGAAGVGAWVEDGAGRRRPIATRPVPADGLTVVGSRR
ncbi:MAG: 3'(2'),5'-bisphosphate nucleotidase CysQ, partial [Burkholderiaceae bacterium]